MKLLTFVIAVLLSTALHAQAQNPVNWTPEQLLQPAALAQTIKADKDLPVIISVGPGAVIPNSIAAGMASSKEGFNKLDSLLNTLPKNQKLVIYCGCCPFEHCPNVRPAIARLKELQFTNFYLLDLPHNIKQDWIDQGYPSAKL